MLTIKQTMLTIKQTMKTPTGTHPQTMLKRRQAEMVYRDKKKNPSPFAGERFSYLVIK